MASNGLARRQLCVAVDASGYSALSDVDQREAQRGIVEVSDAAARAAGLRRDTWVRQGAGDGESAVLPVDEPEDVVVDRYVRELDAELTRYNGRLRTELRLRLRVAVYFGRLSPAANGHAGPAPVAVARLLDSAVLRAALAEADRANLALLVSEQVYADTVASLATTLRPGDFRRVRVEVKGFAENAWLWVPDHDVHAMRLPEPDSPRQNPPRDTDGTTTVTSHFHKRVDAPGAVFGVQFDTGR